MIAPHDSRSACIVHHVNMALRKSALTDRAYGQAVADLYMQRTPPHARSIEFHATRDPYDDERANAQIVRRQLLGEVARMAVDLEEALILALPEPFRGACLRDLAARLDLLAAPRPAADPARQTAHLGEMTKDAGEVLIALAPMFKDGRIDAADAPLAHGALDAIARSMAMLVTLDATIRGSAAGSKEVAACSD
jgi:hypothetical protein